MHSRLFLFFWCHGGWSWCCFSPLTLWARNHMLEAFKQQFNIQLLIPLTFIRDNRQAMQYEFLRRPLYWRVWCSSVKDRKCQKGECVTKDSEIRTRSTWHRNVNRRKEPNTKWFFLLLLIKTPSGTHALMYWSPSPRGLSYPPRLHPSNVSLLTREKKGEGTQGWLGNPTRVSEHPALSIPALPGAGPDILQRSQTTSVILWEIFDFWGYQWSLSVVKTNNTTRWKGAQWYATEGGGLSSPLP